MKKYITEFIGTFFLMLTIAMMLLNPALTPYTPLGVGLMLTGVIYGGGHISKAHYNPAVTIAFYIRGHFNPKHFAGYFIAQFLAIAAVCLIAYLVKAKFGFEAEMSTYTNDLPGKCLAFLAELIGAFALVWVILSVATAKATKGNTYFGIAIGMTVTGLAYTLGWMGTIGCYNPAVALGSFVIGFNGLQNLAIIIIANIIGAVLAAWVCNYLLEE